MPASSVISLDLSLKAGSPPLLMASARVSPSSLSISSSATIWRSLALVQRRITVTEPPASRASCKLSAVVGNTRKSLSAMTSICGPWMTSVSSLTSSTFSSSSVPSSVSVGVCTRMATWRVVLFQPQYSVYWPSTSPLRIRAGTTTVRSWHCRM